MSDLLPVDEALAAILLDAKPESSEAVPLNECHGRILAEDLIATRTQPPFETTAMDGYAVRFRDCTSTPCRLKVIGESAAGHRFSGEIGSGEAVRIFTGAPMPSGADSIVIQENTQRDDDQVSILQPPIAGKFVRPKGLDFKKNDILLRQGQLLSASAIALAASANQPAPLCHIRPKIALISTGDELVAPGIDPSPDQIISSNAFGVGAQIKAFGGEVLDLGIVSDQMEPLVSAMQQAEAAGADIIVTLGGASVGDHDLVGPALEKIGVNVDFWKIAMRPGKPLMFGRKTLRGKTLRYLGLPGNPVSSLVCSRIFLQPLIQALLAQPTRLQTFEARLATDLPANDERKEYMRAKIDKHPDGGFIASPFGKQDSSMVWTAAKANGLVIREINAPSAAKGDVCQFLWFEA